MTEISKVIKKRITDARESAENSNQKTANKRLDKLPEDVMDEEDIHAACDETCGAFIDPPAFHSTDNIAEFIEEGELPLLVDEVTEKFQAVLDSLVIDTCMDHNTQDTARRVAKMFVMETFNGRYVPMPTATSFPNVTKYDQIYIVGPIEIKSTCAHHFQNIVGKCWIGVRPGTEVIGLSKFNRIVDWIARRPSIQEELTEQIADQVEDITKAEGVAVFMRAEHMCMTHRGVKAHASDMKTSVVRGVFRENQAFKDEFFRILAL